MGFFFEAYIMISFALFVPLSKEHDWAGFARKYNGPGYAENAYDQKLKNAYENFKNKI